VVNENKVANADRRAPADRVAESAEWDLRQQDNRATLTSALYKPTQITIRFAELFKRCELISRLDQHASPQSLSLRIDDERPDAESTASQSILNYFEG
jgi:hypothetical protein